MSISITFNRLFLVWSLILGTVGGLGYLGYVSWSEACVVARENHQETQEKIFSSKQAIYESLSSARGGFNRALRYFQDYGSVNIAAPRPLKWNDADDHYLKIIDWAVANELALRAAQDSYDNGSNAYRIFQATYRSHWQWYLTKSKQLEELKADESLPWWCPAD